jgi:hypothetical protein
VNRPRERRFCLIPLRAEQVGHKAGDRIAVVVGRYGGESIIDLDHVALIEVDKL